MIELDAILFDTFGTLVDWRTSLIADLSRFGGERGIAVDWAAFVDAWRGAYAPSMDRVRRRDEPWKTLDALHRDSFDDLARKFGFNASLDENDRGWCVDRWHRLRPWPDTVAGLARLRVRWIVGTLSNGNVRLLADLARSAALPMDVLFSAELFRHYKRDSEVYLGAIELLATTPDRVMLCAAHNDDLAAAKSHGMRTAFVARPTEYGPNQSTDLTAGDRVDIAVRDLRELADRMDA
ncbi:haloacid dehalogenase type II [Vulcanimicrobium alpinum]|nr:haloacid dehalogenase type II [Vulcanimicrobium alpinum]